jgi:peptidoglycan/LPS O-acetylase OafA/YrhL
MTTINAINSIHGQVWLCLFTFAGMLLVYLRYRKFPPAASLVDTLNSLHIALLGFAICILAVLLILAGHPAEGDKIFLSGASFIGGIAAGKVSQNGNGPRQA